MVEQVDSKAEAAAEKAYADAAGQVSPKTADRPAAGAPKPAAKKPAAPKQARAAKPRTKPVRKTAKAKAASKAAKTVSKTRAAKPTLTQLKDKIMATAQKTEKTADFTKTARDAAADFQARARTAYEKSQAYAGEVTEFTKGNVEALVESGKILAAGVQDIARGEVEAAKGAFETATADLKALAAVKSPTELFKLQGEIARRNFDAAVARASKNAEVSLKLANDAFAPISSRMSLAAEKLSKAA